METEVTRNIEEQLSAFLDGELPPAELELLVRRLDRDQEYRDTLARYAAIGCALRKDAVQLASPQLRRRLITAVQDDNPAGSGQSGAAAKPVFLFSGKRAWVAAAVVLLAVVGIYNGGTLDPVTVAPPATQLAAAPPATGRVEPIRSAALRTGVQPARETTRETAINPQRMTSYLVSHGEYSRSFQGAIVDSRIFVQQASFAD